MAELNGVMLQSFHWYSRDDGGFWDELAERAAGYAKAGFTGLWLPPASKGIGGAADVGYGVYDLFDLGEFEQKGSLRTRYGTRNQYLAAVRALQQAGLQVYADAVLNHKMGGDHRETFRAVPFAQGDRLIPCGSTREIEGYTHFAFPGRKGRHSNFEWHWWHFDAVDHDARAPQERGLVYLVEGERFDDFVSGERGNYAYLMGCDLDCQNEWVRGELAWWGKWFLDTAGVDGFRLDAIKHIAAWFFPEWLDTLERHAGRDLFVVGEYWLDDAAALARYLDLVGGRMAVFDVPLHYNFCRAGRAGRDYDLRRIFDGSLLSLRPAQAVPFVDNHDSQPLQALESAVEPWFKPLAYALLLLRRDGYPCVFAADYDGAAYEDSGRDGHRHYVVLPNHRKLIDCFLAARRAYAWGPQYDYFDHPNTVGWTRLGDIAHPGGMAVLLGNGLDGRKWMEVGRAQARYVDATGHCPTTVTTNAEGWGEFFCPGGKVSVWVPEGGQ